MVVTGAPRKRLVAKSGTWVRIPPSPPTFAKRSLRSRLRLAGRVHASTREGCSPKPASVASGLAKVDNSAIREQQSRSAIAYCKRRCFSYPASPRSQPPDQSLLGCSLVAYPAKRFVYIMRSLNHPQKRYVGVTSDVTARVSAHNAGQNRSTARWKPWCIDVAIEFRTERLALRFEKYLKSGAGHDFARGHFVDNA